MSAPNIISNRRKGVGEGGERHNVCMSSPHKHHTTSLYANSNKFFCSVIIYVLIWGHFSCAHSARRYVVRLFSTMSLSCGAALLLLNMVLHNIRRTQNSCVVGSYLSCLSGNVWCLCAAMQSETPYRHARTTSRTMCREHQRHTKVSTFLFLHFWSRDKKRNICLDIQYIFEDRY